MPSPAAISPWADASPAQVRGAIRRGELRGPTAGMARGYAQCNLAVVPADVADAFAEFCRLNARACPLVYRSGPGEVEPRDVAPGADLRTDLPRYRVFRHGKPEAEQPCDLSGLWQSNLVAFLLGCSFTFEQGLEQAGLEVRHLRQGCNVPMYRTAVACQGAGPFQGNLVVSMRPYLPEQVERVREITAQFPTMHGGPIHVGDPRALGIAELTRPDFGDAVTIRPGEVPVFWACGVTPQLALENAGLPLAFTHSPGCMFLTDRTDESYRRMAPA